MLLSAYVETVSVGFFINYLKGIAANYSYDNAATIQG